MIEVFLFGIVLGLISITLAGLFVTTYLQTLAGLFVTTYLQYRRGDQLDLVNLTSCGLKKVGGQIQIVVLFFPKNFYLPKQ